MAVVKEIEIKVNTSNAVKNVDNLNNSVKGTKKEVDESGKAMSGLTGKIDSLTGGAITKFKGFTSALSGVAGGFKGVGAAIALSGLGLLILTIAAVTAAFKNTEAGQNKFAKIMAVIGSVTGNLIDILSSFGEVVISVFENPQKAIKDFANLIKDNITNRLTGLMELIPNLGKAVKLLFEGNFKEAAKVAADATGKVTLGIESVSDSLDKATNKTKLFIAELEREAKIAGQIADKRAQADTTERNLIVKRAEADEKIAVLREKALLRDKFSAGERIKFLKEASKIEEDITKQEIQTAILRRDALIDENKQSGSNKDALKAEEEAKAKVIQLNTARLQGQRRLTATIQSLQLEEQGIYKATADAKKKIDDDSKLAEEKRRSDILKIIDDFSKKEEDLLAKTNIEKLNLEEQRALAELDKLRATEEEKLNIKKYFNGLRKEEEDKVNIELANIGILKQEAERNLVLDQKQWEIDNETDPFTKLEKQREIIEEQGALDLEKIQRDIDNANLSATERTNAEIAYAAKKQEIDQSVADNSKKTADEEKLYRQQVKDASVSLAGQTLTLLGNLAKEGSALSKGVAVSQAIIDTYKGATSAFTSMSGIPIVGPALGAVAAGLAVASGFANVKKILSTKPIETGSGGGSASVPAPPPPPSFNLVQGTGSNQIAESIASDKKPISAFVVSSSVTSQQELDRNANNEASIG